MKENKVYEIKTGGQYTLLLFYFSYFRFYFTTCLLSILNEHNRLVGDGRYALGNSFIWYVEEPWNEKHPGFLLADKNFLGIT